MDIKSLECPKCGAPIQLPDGAGATYACPYCNNIIAVPTELRRRTGFADDPSIQAALRPENLMEEVARFKEVKALAMAGKKIEAIKLLRELTDMGLAEAKTAVENIEAGRPLVLNGQAGFQVQASAQAAGDVGLEQAVQELLRRNQKIEAIKVLRMARNIGLAEAKAAVEAVERGMPLSEALSGLPSTASAPAYQPAGVFTPPPAAHPYQPAGLEGSKPSGGIGALLGRLGGCLLIMIILVAAVGVPIAAIVMTTDNPINAFIQKINPFSAIRLVVTSGGEGSGQGFFDDPRAIAVDGKGYVYVADYSDGRVQRFDNQGKFQNGWLIPPPANSKNIYISGMAASSEGQVYVIASGAILVFDGASGRQTGQLSITPPGEDSPIYADDIAMAPNNHLVVIYGGENVVTVDQTGAVLQAIPAAFSSITKDSELDAKAAVDATGNFFLIGSFNYAVVHYSPDGRFTNQFGSEGSKEGQFQSPLAITVDPYGRLIVSDMNTLNIFEPDGRFVQRITIDGVAFGLAFDSSGRLWTTNNRGKLIAYELTPPQK